MISCAIYLVIFKVQDEMCFSLVSDLDRAAEVICIESIAKMLDLLS